MDGRQRICIVSAGSLCSGPRVVKEADALAAAGYRVHVVVCQTLAWMQAWDQRLAQGRGWSYSAVVWDRRAKRSLEGVAGKAAQLLARGASRRLIRSAAVAAVGLDGRSLALLRRTRHHRADLFLAHNLAALPVAFAVARAQGALLGFDAEDDHFGQFGEGDRLGLDAQLVDRVMSALLPRCDHITAASPGIADALRARYGVERPTPIHNVFPWSERDGLPAPAARSPGEELALTWCSQTVGLDRGLQDLLRAAGRVRGPLRILLRGDAPGEVRARLLEVARESGVADRLSFVPQVPPEELLGLSAEHDVGFAVEQPTCPNHLVAASNKLFHYLLAGLAVAATDTPGQRRVLAETPEVGFLYPPGDVGALARGLQRLRDDPAALRAMKDAALEAARVRWSWEVERPRLVEAVGRVLPLAGRGARGLQAEAAAGAAAHGAK